MFIFHEAIVISVTCFKVNIGIENLRRFYRTEKIEVRTKRKEEYDTTALFYLLCSLL